MVPVLVAVPLLACVPTDSVARADDGGTAVTRVSAPPPTGIESRGTADFVDVVTSSGLVDPILASFLSDSIREANQQPSTCSSGSHMVACREIALVWQMDSEGVVVPDTQFAALLEQVRTSAVPVYVWIGPTGSQLTGEAAAIAGVAAGVGMSPGTSIGLGGKQLSARAAAVATTRQVPSGLVDAQDAQNQGITGGPAPTIGDFAVNIPGFAAKEVTKDGQTRREPVTLVRFETIPLVSQLMHSVASPSVAYLLMCIGMALLIFELFTAGVGVAGGVGAGSVVLGCYGLAVLPVRPWAVALLVVSMIAFAIDVQTGIPRFWTGAGLVLFVAGSVTLFSAVSLSWVALGAAVLGALLTFLSGMPSMVRTRFSTPTIGRDWMIGETGRAITDIDPDGVVQIKGAPWRACTSRATPLEQLDPVRVVGIDGMVLEVAPQPNEGPSGIVDREPVGGEPDG